MRTIQLPAGTRRTTQHTVQAVLRALERRGTHEWVHHNVVRDLTDYITAHLPDQHVTVEQVSYALSWFEKRGYATRELSERGRRTVRFTVHDDVELTTLRPSPATQALLDARSNGRDERWGRYGSALRPRTTTSPLTPDQPPLPFGPSTPVYRLQELHAALTAWAETDREAYAVWVDRVLGQLTDPHTEPPETR